MTKTEMKQELKNMLYGGRDLDLNTDYEHNIVDTVNALYKYFEESKRLAYITDKDKTLAFVDDYVADKASVYYDYEIADTIIDVTGGGLAVYCLQQVPF